MIPAVETRELTRKYGDHIAVQNLNLVVGQGEIFALLGHNGAGKTTTISMLTTLLLPTAGTIRIFGLDAVSENLKVRQMIGYVPESVRLYNDLSVRENLEFFAALSAVEDVRTRIQYVLEVLGHPEWANLHVGSLSKGMRQRVGIAQALLHEPRLLFLDEPASGLDPEGTHAVVELVRSLNKSHGMTIFMNTHRLAEATNLCTSIGIMDHGHLVASDTLNGLRSRFPEGHSLEQIYLELKRGQAVAV